MKIHANARTTIKTRAVLVDQVIRHQKTKAETARAFGTRPTTVAKWVDRYRREGPRSVEIKKSSSVYSRFERVTWMPVALPGEEVTLQVCNLCLNSTDHRTELRFQGNEADE